MDFAVQPQGLLFRSRSDPSRRMLFKRLCREGALTVGALAPLVDWTRQMTDFCQARFDALGDLLNRMDQ